MFQARSLLWRMSSVAKWVKVGLMGAVLTLSMGVSSGWAYMVSPLKVDMNMGGATTITVSNGGAQRPLTFETTILKRTISEDGKTVTEPAPDDFVVVPPSGIVDAGASQALRVQYVGEAAQEKSVHYYLNVTEIPIKLDEPKVVSGSNAIQATINMAFAYNVALNVSPMEGKSDIKILSVTGGKKIERKSQNKDEPTKVEDGLELVVENTGNRYGYISDYTLEVKGGPQGKMTISSKELKRAEGSSVLPALSKRRFLVTVPAPLPNGPVEARLVPTPQQ